MVILFFVFIFSLCWGSFLNVTAYRSISDKPFLQKRSSCNFCNKTIAWYDNIPILSWLFLAGKCRFCKKPISILYPFIELLTAIIITGLFFNFFYINSELLVTKQNILSFICYFIFFSNLIIATRTDLEELVIPQLFSIWMVPVGLTFSYLNFLEISFFQSFLGAIIGYFGLLLVAKVFKFFTKKDGLGIGDMELLAMIGAFLGPIGVWFSIFIGSLVGVLISIFYLAITKKDRSTLIPFGPFLAFGATIFFFFKDFLINYFF